MLVCVLRQAEGARVIIYTCEAQFWFRKVYLIVLKQNKIELGFHRHENSVPTETVFRPPLNLRIFRRIGGELHSSLMIRS